MAVEIVVSNTILGVNDLVWNKLDPNLVTLIFLKITFEQKGQFVGCQGRYHLVL